MGRFRLLADLGTVTVPSDYCHSSCVSHFMANHSKDHFVFDKCIDDSHFPTPSCVLFPGKKIQVLAFVPVVPDDFATLRECRQFLSQYKPLYVGVQGLILVYEQMRAALPKEKIYVSIDKDSSLRKVCMDNTGEYQVPGMFVRYIEGQKRSYSYYSLDLFVLGAYWQRELALLCFCECPA